MNIQQLLFDLTSADFIGSVRDCANVIDRYISPFVDEITHRPDGTVIAKLNGNHKNIMLEAHIDQVGFIVTDVFDDGFIRINKIGSPDIRVLPASELKIYGSEIVYGIVCSTPPHLQKGGADKYPDISEMFVDTGLMNIKDIVKVGDYAVYSTTPQMLDENIITSKSLDNRTACAALIMAAEYLSCNRPECSITFMFSCAEELGGAGAITGAFSQEIDCAIVSDVSFAKTPDTPSHMCGVVSNGAMIGISPVFPRKISNKLKNICEDKKIPYQLEVMGGLSSTDADKIAISKQGVPCGLISIPLKNMHTPVELCDIRDISAVSDLMTAFVEKWDGEHNA
ncbi:MAG: M20/M25/M40 family metallo-hydrolase [Acutalibacteraceae bacterium]|nr:M20/M25/M40 family metallo-hydrolase [Clostridia bacterium]MEE1143734.1 M20/M25/M40 family metallo-hydrolase [Acutalibacteraceae bacterium]